MTKKIDHMPGYPEKPGMYYYTVQPGDTLRGIAQSYGVTVEAILRYNPQITDPNRIYVGQRILIPGYGYGPGYGADPALWLASRIVD